MVFSVVYKPLRSKYMLKKMVYLGAILTALTVISFVQPATAGEYCKCKGKKEKEKDKDKEKSNPDKN